MCATISRAAKAETPTARSDSVLATVRPTQLALAVSALSRPSLGARPMSESTSQKLRELAKHTGSSAERAIENSVVDRVALFFAEPITSVTPVRSELSAARRDGQDHRPVDKAPGDRIDELRKPRLLDVHAPEQDARCADLGGDERAPSADVRKVDDRQRVTPEPLNGGGEVIGEQRLGLGDVEIHHRRPFSCRTSISSPEASRSSGNVSLLNFTRTEPDSLARVSSSDSLCSLPCV